MAETTFTITTANIGEVLPVVNGFLRKCVMTRSPSRYDAATMGPDGTWVSGYFCLHDDSKCLGDFFSIDQNNPCIAAFHSIDIAYRGGLLVRAVPVGSEWEVVLSDTAIRQAA